MNLSARHAELMYQEPRLRIRDAAQRLGTTEAALVALQGGTTLRPDWPALFAALPRSAASWRSPATSMRCMSGMAASRRSRPDPAISW
jgi:hypothetical protein